MRSQLAVGVSMLRSLVGISDTQSFMQLAERVSLGEDAWAA